ncbi:hypothetical protein OIDMADRAFT_46476 [Oidiodendron maius Zn]|uniref:Fatty acid desaturase domain-containing protein n=1 Tax=Oidiodendron maius (strain Zn) TaxID=913774 RepID=A0A0C3GN23_OIDMZ|nr:hypothetical protein OIDMADRAFT_46476 [Oidiodendron maius Zn]
MKEIYDAIPPHCFNSSAMRSLFYFARDVGYISIPVYTSSFIQYIQGMCFTGIWILAHECGHGAFSKYKKLNLAMGLLMHSFLLVPFYSWRITHGAHHKGTGNLEKDTAFVPRSRKAWAEANFGTGADTARAELSHLAEDAPLVFLWNCLMHQLLGWPGYLLFNDSPFWKKDQLPLIVLSNIAVMRMIVMLATGRYFFGFVEMLLAITFLHHMDGSLPHYQNSTWTFVRGATATIDRDFGFINKHLFHNIVGTHICHHLISTIPFYHTREASIAIRKVMGRHYRSNTKTSFMTAFWKTSKERKFIEESVDGSGVRFFRNLHGVDHMTCDVNLRKRVTEAKGILFAAPNEPSNRWIHLYGPLRRIRSMCAEAE